LSLLEVILAIAILAAGMTLIGELMRIGGRHATAAVDLTKAQMYCESVVSEIAIGSIAAQAVDQTPMEIDPGWLYSVDVQDVALQGLISVRVSVQSAADTSLNPRGASLTRWMIDPDLDLTEQAEDQEAMDPVP
jgi:Tfp pilus assembly protein PilV